MIKTAYFITKVYLIKDFKTNILINNNIIIYRVYSDSQASLKVARSMGSEWDQGRLRRILNAHEAISARGATLSLVWIPGHRGVLGNEMADKAAERTQREREPAGIVREPAAKVA